MKTSTSGVSLIKNFEGLSLSAYRDVAGVWTIGYGSTRYHDGKPVKPGDKLATREQADALLLNTLSQYEEAVNYYVKVPLQQAQFDALVSFTYNEGTGALKESTLLRKLNEKNYAAAADQLLLWDKVTDPKTGEKKAWPVLSRRRRQERDLFFSVSPNQIPV
ncbi:lysozyme [Mucilaginibacter ginsenosidivorans]|uniref:Lysozyme n=1 Tax=Mucilaginibacter ginsenosidivorans TaxID=398053 RepID=A0A5B8UYB3_9SPHI|nr:lysozyme [Mucilaginibacter ginsenosidivorans]QEC63331.1 lysozyme [Mucilaginibacter ginsenosidivorans]